MFYISIDSLCNKKKNAPPNLTCFVKCNIFFLLIILNNAQLVLLCVADLCHLIAILNYYT